jgi:aminoglycoside phosphotransferase (APT) family kinase protein
MDADALTALVRAALPGADVAPLPPLRGSENAHAEARLPDGTALFVKVYRYPERCAAERVVLGALGARYDWPILPVTSGAVGGVAWQAFPLLDLTSVEAPPYGAWGARLADVHACPPPEGLPRKTRAVDQVGDRLARLRDPAVASAASALWDAVAGTVGAAAAARETAPVLLMNDFHLRNTALRPDGVLTLVDFERAETGDPHWDLGKVWDDGLTEEADRAAFLAGAAWPHGPTLWVTRFAGALATIPYAERVGDPVFRAHAVAVLAALRAEV